ncbi:MAG: DUF427 domain-containing protein [Pseudomonadota bacterium]
MDDRIISEDAVHDGYRVKITPVAATIRAVVNGVAIAESASALVMHETRYPPVFYFPEKDVQMAHLKASDHNTHCPFKGNANHWTLTLGKDQQSPAAWQYGDPFDESAAVKGYVAFVWDMIDEWYSDDTLLEAPTSDHDPAISNPFVDWLVERAWQPRNVPDLLTEFASVLKANHFPISRVRILIQTLHPQLFALAYTWENGVEGIDEFQATHAGLQSVQYQASPFATILRGEGGIRRRLEGPNVRLDYPILEDLKAEGATDYVAVPLRFTDGQTNILVLVSDQPGGFSTEQLGQLYEILANLSRLLEAHAQRLSSLTLLQTYLGKNAGQRVLDGLIKRGDGEEMQAIIWMSDLRGSTKLAETLSRTEYLEALNQYFDSVAGAVIENGGEVLKFIGDAVLAIFTLDDDPACNRPACERAIKAVRAAQTRMESANGEREAKGLPTLAFGTALHIGALTYGNIGTTRRLDFTVIGSAVNEASRIEGLCKALGQSVLISSAFADKTDAELISAGTHQLRGVSEAQELFTLTPEQSSG